PRARCSTYACRARRARTEPQLFSGKTIVMQRFTIDNGFGQPLELIGEEIIVPGFEELQFILHAWLYDKHGGWAITERSSGKRITSGPAGTEEQARMQL